ncbi:MAG: hypothetical protein WAU75_16465, partial [Solirubrobacteraceae bacterium]
MTRPFGVETVVLDLAPLVGGFGRRLHDAGVPVSAERAARCAVAMRLVGRAGTISRRRLYWTARAVFVSDPSQVRVFDRVFAEVFGAGAGAGDHSVSKDVRQVPAASDDDRPAVDPSVAADDAHQHAWAAGATPSPSPSVTEPAEQELPVGVLAS